MSRDDLQILIDNINQNYHIVVNYSEIIFDTTVYKDNLFIQQAYNKEKCNSIAVMLLDINQVIYPISKVVPITTIDDRIIVEHWPRLDRARVQLFNELIVYLSNNPYSSKNYFKNVSMIEEPVDIKINLDDSTK